MELTALDYAIIILYFLVALGIGLYYSRRAGRSLEDYIVSGRSLPWWIAGTSMVATTFAADTPLAVTELVIKNGIAGNWLWWSMAIGGMLTVFFFARLWRRAGVMTDVELAEVRYSGASASFLRGFRAVYIALFLNSLIIAWVTIAMVTVLEITLDWDPNIMILALVAMTGLYAVLSGLWGVVVTDFIQFLMAIFGCIVLAWLAVDKVGGISGLQSTLNSHFGMDNEVMRFVPSLTSDWMPFQLFCVYLGVLWWASWYPGAEPGGGGYVVQRMASCKDERHSVLATLWFTVAHYCIRPWPWILIALAALAIYPELKGAENPGEGFPMMMKLLLPPGLRGLLLVSFFAAYMSTLSTQINWATSYLVSDFYKRFLVKNAGEKHYTLVSRLTTVLVLIFGIGMTFLLRASPDIKNQVSNIWKLLLLFGAGTGSVLILRWYWWRVNAWSEISSMIASAVGALYVTFFGGSIQGEFSILYVTLFSIAVWIIVTLLTPPTEESKLLAFYRKVRPGGPGWRRIRPLAPEVVPDRTLHLDFLNWVLGVAAVFCALFGIGYLILGRIGSGLGLLAVVALSAGVISYNLSRFGWDRRMPEEQPRE
jgi:solute:Na+ symporter, SSS family